MGRERGEERERRMTFFYCFISFFFVFRFHCVRCVASACMGHPYSCLGCDTNTCGSRGSKVVEGTPQCNQKKNWKHEKQKKENQCEINNRFTVEFVFNFILVSRLRNSDWFVAYDIP